MFEKTQLALLCKYVKTAANQTYTNDTLSR